MVPGGTWVVISSGFNQFNDQPIMCYCDQLIHHSIPYDMYTLY